MGDGAVGGGDVNACCGAPVGLLAIIDRRKGLVVC